MASDHGGHPSTSSQASPQPKNTRATSYASVTQNDQFPKKEQAIVIEAKEGILLKDYVTKIGELVNPTKIRFASKISNSSVCIFLSMKGIAEELTSKHQQVNMNNQVLEIRPLITKHTRVIISNVYATIPHSYIEDALDTLNIKKASPVSFLRAGISDAGYAHILSFRRQVYIHSDDLSKLPNLLHISHDDTKYYIYPSTDSPKCFVCKKEGHVAKNCPEAKPAEGEIKEIQPETQENIETNSENGFVSPLIPPDLQNLENDNTSPADKFVQPPNMSIKRTRSVASSSDSNTADTENLPTK